MGGETMRDPIENVKSALRDAGAVYKGGGTPKGSAGVFPDGEEFLFERKAGSPTIDARVATRKLHQVLARRNGQVQAAAVQQVNAAVHADAPVTPAVAVPSHEPIQALDTPPSTSMKDRWGAALAQAEVYQEKLLADAQLAERRVLMLKAMVPFMEDPTFADAMWCTKRGPATPPTRRRPPGVDDPTSKALLPQS
jgi:hypothetical protein